MKPIAVSIIIPAFNEAANIAPLIEELCNTLDNRITYELIYVDDGSTDATLTELRSIQSNQLPALRILHHETQCGQSAAIVSGVCAAQAPWVITMDADGQNDPADIPLLLEQLEHTDTCSQPVLISGYRINRQDDWLKRSSSRIANFLRERVLHDETLDTGCALKLFSREAFLALPHFDHMHRFLPALFKRQGASIRIIPVSHRPRRYGTSNYGVHNRLWVGIIDMLGVAWLQSRYNPPGSIKEYKATHLAEDTIQSLTR